MDKTIMPDDNGNNPKSYTVPAVEQAIRVLGCLADNGNSSMSLTDICREVGIHRSKAFSILNTLGEHGFVKKNPNRGGYILGPGLLTVTGKMLETLSLPRVAEPVLYDLARKVKATVTIGLISDDKAYIVAEYLGAPGIGISSPIGYVTPVSYGAHGKIIAAFLPPNDLNEMLKAKDLYFYGDPKNYDRAKLLKELEQYRRTGYSLELGNIQQGMNAVAVPILDRNEYPVGYVTVVGFFTEKEAATIGPLAVTTVQTISNELGHMILWQKANKRRNFDRQM